MVSSSADVTSFCTLSGYFSKSEISSGVSVAFGAPRFFCSGEGVGVSVGVGDGVSVGSGVGDDFFFDFGVGDGVSFSADGVGEDFLFLCADGLGEGVGDTLSFFFRCGEGVGVGVEKTSLIFCPNDCALVDAGRVKAIDATMQV